MNNVANSANTVLPNAGTLEVHKNSDGDGDGIIKNSERKLNERKLFNQSMGKRTQI